ncbi:hypothetical protein [Clostridium aminobutyricum]|uniref:Uncharacterized protein n=1 Tax=Clostridium aminobutyricum TaxID=33953 RepID=A0A939IIY5_CLOAM|nr:hypothetical protein [Clostridium aminobutyricum]MBN7773009.1 hypothetical protein [Clostridium aminobutyricum]
MQRNRGYRFVFWGLVLSILHINIGEMEILPNFIAVLIIAKGISIVLEDNGNKYLLRARMLCRIYAGVQGAAFVMEMVKEGLLLNNIDAVLNETLTLLLFASNSILNIAFLFYLFMGSELLLFESRRDCFTLGREIDEYFTPERNLRKVATKFAVLYTIGTVLMMGGLVFRNDFGILAVIGAIAAFAGTVWVASNIAYIRRQYPEYR